MTIAVPSSTAPMAQHCSQRTHGNPTHGGAAQPRGDPHPHGIYHSVLLTASPKPGVSTMVRRSLTPFSSMSTTCLVISTVCVMRSVVAEDTSMVGGTPQVRDNEGVTGRRCSSRASPSPLGTGVALQDQSRHALGSSTMLYSMTPTSTHLSVAVPPLPVTAQLWQHMGLREHFWLPVPPRVTPQLWGCTWPQAPPCPCIPVFPRMLPWYHVRVATSILAFAPSNGNKSNNCLKTNQTTASNP